MTKKHKHYCMIVAKAENMDLVVISQSQRDGSWLVQNDQGTTDFGECINYFLCLPEHKDCCLYWLNGGSLQDFFEDEWTKVRDYDGSPWEEADNMFMNEEYNFKIKPKLVKIHKYLLVNTKTGAVGVVLADTKTQARGVYSYDDPIWRVQEVSFDVEVVG